MDPNTKSVGPPPEWVRPTDANGHEQAGPMAITMNGHNRSQVASSSPSGSPPLPTTSTRDDPNSRPPTGNGNDLSRSITSPSSVPPVPPLPGYPLANSNDMSYPGSPMRSTSGGGRMQSPSGGVNVVLDGSNPWPNNMNSVNIAAPITTNQTAPRQKPSGMLGFLSKRNRRGASPKPMERGVLGREGARIHIS